MGVDRWGEVVEGGGEDLCKLVCTGSEYLPRNPVGSSCFPGVDTAEHPSHLLHLLSQGLVAGSQPGEGRCGHRVLGWNLEACKELI